MLEPIESRLEGSDAFEQEDFYQQALDAFRFDGELVCLPQNISSLVVYYNRDLFRAKGFPSRRQAGRGTTWSTAIRR